MGMIIKVIKMNIPQKIVHEKEYIREISIENLGINKKLRIRVSIRDFKFKYEILCDYKDNKIVGEFDLKWVQFSSIDHSMMTMDEMNLHMEMCKEVFNKLKEIDLKFFIGGYGDLEYVVIE